MTMHFDTILYETDDRIARIRFNRPERMNAFAKTTMAEVKEAFAAADRDPDVRVVLVQGVGGKAFSSGYDIKESADQPERTAADWRNRVSEDLQFTYAPWECSKPVIAIIEGYCVGGGLEFALCCDIRYCSPDARFGVVEARFATGLSTLMMPWVVGNYCRKLIYTGDEFGADEARRIGLVDDIYEKDALDREVTKIARRMSQVAQEYLTLNKAAINQTFEIMGLRSALGNGAHVAAAVSSSNPPEFQEYNRIRRTQGLKEALKWRAARFEPFE